MDDFSLLGVAPGADLKEIKRARRVLAKVHHPDRSKNPASATEILGKINAAYDRIVAGNPRRENTKERQRATTRPMGPEDFPDFDKAKPEQAKPQPNKAETSSHSHRDRRREASQEAQTQESRTQGSRPEEAKPSSRRSNPYTRQTEAPRANTSSGHARPKSTPYARDHKEPPKRPETQYSREQRVAQAAYARAQKYTGNQQKPRKHELDITL